MSFANYKRAYLNASSVSASGNCRVRLGGNGGAVAAMDTVATKTGEAGYAGLGSSIMGTQKGLHAGFMESITQRAKGIRDAVGAAAASDFIGSEAAQYFGLQDLPLPRTKGYIEKWSRSIRGQPEHSPESLASMNARTAQADLLALRVKLEAKVAGVKQYAVEAFQILQDFFNTDSFTKQVENQVIQALTEGGSIEEDGPDATQLELLRMQIKEERRIHPVSQASTPLSPEAVAKIVKSWPVAKKKLDAFHQMLQEQGFNTLWRTWVWGLSEAELLSIIEMYMPGAPAKRLAAAYSEYMVNHSLNKSVLQFLRMSDWTREEAVRAWGGMLAIFWWNYTAAAVAGTAVAAGMLYTLGTRIVPGTMKRVAALFKAKREVKADDIKEIIDDELSHEKIEPLLQDQLASDTAHFLIAAMKIMQEKRAKLASVLVPWKPKPSLMAAELSS